MPHCRKFSIDSGSVQCSVDSLEIFLQIPRKSSPWFKAGTWFSTVFKITISKLLLTLNFYTNVIFIFPQIMLSTHYTNNCVNTITKKKFVEENCKKWKHSTTKSILHKLPHDMIFGLLFSWHCFLSDSCWACLICQTSNMISGSIPQWNNGQLGGFMWDHL